MRPTARDLAFALRYIRGEYTLRDGGVDGEMVAEGLALGPPDACRAEWEPTAWELEDAARFAPEWGDDAWWGVRARADFLRASDFGLPPRYAREGACVCSRDLLSRVSCRCRYRSV